MAVGKRLDTLTSAIFWTGQSQTQPVSQCLKNTPHVAAQLFQASSLADLQVVKGLFQVWHLHLESVVDNGQCDKKELPLPVK